MPKTDGPKVELKLSCADCIHCVSERYEVQGDSGHDVYCDHSSLVARRRIGDTSWSTPRWCPLRAGAIDVFVNSKLDD